MEATQALQLPPLQKKWGTSLDEGFLLIPVLLLKRQRELALDSTEVVVLLNLLAAWWDTETRPYPRSTTIAQRIGVTPRTVQRCLEKLEKKGLIVRVRNGTGIGAAHRELTSYDMTGTVEKLQRLAGAAEIFREMNGGRRAAAETQLPSKTSEMDLVFPDEAQRR